jgi:hypothetical protein
MKKKYYLLAVEGGVEPFVQGPYETEDERDHAAEQIHRGQEEDDGLFWADIDDAAGLTVGSYAAGFFWEDPTEDV